MTNELLLDSLAYQAITFYYYYRGEKKPLIFYFPLYFLCTENKNY